MSYDDNGRDGSDDALPDNYDDMVVVSPEDEDDDDTVNGSPVERIERDLPQKVHRNFVASSDDHALVETAGTKEALLSNVPVDIQQVVAQGLYEEDDVFFREYIQNAIAACVREGRRVVRNIYGDDALYRYVTHDHPSLDGERQIKLPKKARDILDLAREHGYVPNIEIEVNYDESKLIVRDNGIGMTTGEVIEVWKEPAQSGSGRDQASAGNKGIGSLTWVNIAGEDGAMIVRTATRREQTADGQPVPQRDRDGFSFFTFFGGVVPIENEVEDGFYGTEFEIPVPDSHDMTTFKDKAAKYCDILPVEVTWYETENGITEDSEFEASAPTDQYDREPPISIERPGEFSVYLGPAELVPKGHGDDDTWLLDNPIDRNLSEKTSTRWPAFLRERIDVFRAGYNARLRESDLSEAEREQFLLDSKSDARRRLVDIGLAVAADDELPFGFEFDFSEWGADDSAPVCPKCGASDESSFRVGATDVEGASGVRYETAECQDCGHRAHLSEVMRSRSLFG
jgi:hypothetical protein